MKNYTLKKTSKYVLTKAFIFTFLGFGALTSFAQVQNNGILYVGNTGNFFVGSGAFNFGTGVSTGTTKLATPTSSPVFGTISFGPTTTYSGAGDSHHINGYARLITSNQAGVLAFTSGSTFTFPVGDGTTFAPATVTATPTVNLNPIDCAYYRANPAVVGTVLDASVSALSSLEYWNIKASNNAIVSLTWRGSSNLSTFVSPLSNLTIAGYDGTKWVEIPSLLSGTLSSGSIASNAAVDLSVYSFFTLAARGNSCAPLVASSGITKTWNGATWTPSTPTIADPVVLTGAYNAGSFACNSLAMGANNITLTDGQSVEIVNGVTGTGKIIMSSNANVVQRATGIAGPNIELTKKTANKRQFDYVYWGTPIAENFISQIANAQASTATQAGAFDFLYKYVSGVGGGWQSLSATETGKGFISRIKQQAPFTSAAATDFINMKFTGVANNGDITVPVTNNPSDLDGGTSHILLGNPYPSTIDADKFLVENETIDGVVYVWASATSNDGISGIPYSQGDYLVYTKAGTTVPNTIVSPFDGKIPSGQGFKVKSLVNSGIVTFTNCMRLTANNSSIYRTNASSVIVEHPKDRYKLTMKGNNGVFSQILVAYLPETTLGYDRLYDAGRNSVATAQLYSVLEGDGRQLAINARPPFTNTDVVPLGISKSESTPENFTISITEKEGVFTTPDVTVYIHDILNNTYHNLNNGDFTFSSNTTSVLGRYEIVYQASTLSNPQYNATDVIASIQNNTLNIKSASSMVAIEVYDLIGKKILQSEIQNSLDFSILFNFPQAVYIAKVKLESGAIATLKLVNPN